MQDIVRQYELDVEQARAKLRRDLSTLTSPQTFEAFKTDLKRDAVEAKDELLGQAKDAVQSKFTGVVDDLKAKAAANPVAALMIGAGVGWYMLRHPPVSTALIGVGLVSLLRTTAVPQPHAQTSDYVRQGQERLTQQVSEMASNVAESAKALASDAGDAIADKSSEMITTVKDKTSDALDAARAKFHDIKDATRSHAAAGSAAVKDQVDTIIARAGGTASTVAGQARQVANDTAASVQNALPDVEARDRAMLGVAGLAVAAALGIAWHRRITEPS